MEANIFIGPCPALPLMLGRTDRFCHSEKKRTVGSECGEEMGGGERCRAGELFF